MKNKNDPEKIIMEFFDEKINYNKSIRLISYSAFGKEIQELKIMLLKQIKKELLEQFRKDKIK